MGFVVHPDKSTVIPSHKLVFLGFIFDSMSVSLTNEKALNPKQAAVDLLHCKRLSIRDVATVLWAYGPLHFCYLEWNKTAVLKSSSCRVFDAKMCLSIEARDKLQWRIDSIEIAYNPIKRGEVNITLTSDASKQGWGAIIGDSSTGVCGQSLSRRSILFLFEMLAVFFALISFSSLTRGKNVKVMVDNTTTQSTIYQIGTSQ